MAPVRQLKPQPGLTRQVYRALLEDMAEGRLVAGQHLVQEQIAARLGVSRQPIQQALALLRNEGLVLELGKRGVFVAPLDVSTMRHRYEVRAALDGLAARQAAARMKADPKAAAIIGRKGRALIDAGRAALARGRVSAMVQCDVAFHDFICEASGNPLIAPTAALHWRQLRRVMGEVLRKAETPAAIWQQHQAILDAVLSGDSARAEAAAVAHVWTAADRLERVLSQEPPRLATDVAPPRRKRATAVAAAARA